MPVSTQAKSARRFKRGEVYKVSLPKQRIASTKKGAVWGHELFDYHPCVIWQSGSTIKEMATAIVIPLSSARDKPEWSSWIEVADGTIEGLKGRGFLMCEQIRCVDKRRIDKRVGKLSLLHMLAAEKVLDQLNADADADEDDD